MPPRVAASLALKPANMERAGIDAVNPLISYGNNLAQALEALRWSVPRVAVEANEIRVCLTYSYGIDAAIC